MEPSQLLGLSVVAAIVTTAGSLLALFLKEYIFSRSFEGWKNRNSLQQVYEKYREPVVLAALDLCRRLDEICRLHPAYYLDAKYLGVTAQVVRSNDSSDTYFRQYMLLSTIYRLCAFLGWLENYRNEAVFLGSSGGTGYHRLEEALADVRADMADGKLNTTTKWMEWNDSLIFREEQRAIGEAMIVTSSNGVKSIIGYGKFVEAVQDPAGGMLHNRWFDVAARFFLDPVEKKEFRFIRYQRLVVHLVSLIEVLDRRRVSDDHESWRRKYSERLDAFAASRQEETDQG